MNIVVLVSGGGTNLQAILDAISNKSITNCNISAVISSNKDAYALTRAKNFNLETIVIDRKSYNEPKLYNEELLKVLTKINPELIVLAGFMTILDDDIINKFQNKIINVHPSLIPSFCGKGYYGLFVHKAVLEYGVKITGATVHYVNNVVDGGKIILQKAVEVLENDTPQTLQKRVMETAEWEILPKAINLLCNRKD
ncbi:MAG: phosphoribosylglycinamide formyltransferase [Clostridia bacterium]